MILGNFCGDGFAGVHVDGAVGIQKLQSDFDRIPKINECHRIGLTENGQGLPGRAIVPMGPASQSRGFLFGLERECMVSPVVSSVATGSMAPFGSVDDMPATEYGGRAPGNIFLDHTAVERVGGTDDFSGPSASCRPRHDHFCLIG